MATFSRSVPQHSASGTMRLLMAVQKCEHKQWDETNCQSQPHSATKMDLVPIDWPLAEIGCQSNGNTCESRSPEQPVAAFTASDGHPFEPPNLRRELPVTFRLRSGVTHVTPTQLPVKNSSLWKL